jgi:hypothetical protein
MRCGLGLAIEGGGCGKGNCTERGREGDKQENMEGGVDLGPLLASERGRGSALIETRIKRGEEGGVPSRRREGKELNER